MTKSLYFYSELPLNSVHLLFLNKEHQQTVEKMVTNDNMTWTINVLSPDDIKCYVFIANETYWICDKSKELIMVNGYWYSNFNSKISDNEKITVGNTYFCKDFNSVDFSPIGKASTFSNIDTIMGFWAELKNVKHDTIIYFQLIEPNGALAVMTFEKLIVRPENTNIFYFGFQINQYIEQGNWKFRLIYNDLVLTEKECHFRKINNTYRINSAYNNSPSHIDKKY
ncbi:hypothetical protein KZ483_27615 [Paenibacillus sp. sptzw28]|uniref:hypothetical protein n=1 Tax=Paenibacillus sp. sptzw28 TaxID=715179 RepID=UPI001C6ECB34|nr:hypothetical protein [Paenibacillus sp. sptzw28]QYR21393.1 hypothetical protein KZ483_27615 [Paenibacillus sp. sptzw28]